jgi:hypothetical protein
VQTPIHNAAHTSNVVGAILLPVKGTIDFKSANAGGRLPPLRRVMQVQSCESVHGAIRESPLRILRRLSYFVGAATLPPAVCTCP